MHIILLFMINQSQNKWKSKLIHKYLRIFIGDFRLSLDYDINLLFRFFFGDKF